MSGGARLLGAVAVVVASTSMVAGSAVASASGPVVQIGSKKFTESVILGELLTQLAASRGVGASHRRELGGTRVLWSALRRGDIDAYPEYTGTIREEILAGEAVGVGLGDLSRALAGHGIRMSAPLGFNDTYAIGMREEVAARLRIGTISDLVAHPDLALGLSNEFMDRGDGWPALRTVYALPHTDVRGLDHDLAYRGLESGSIDVTDLYSTDAEIRYYGLRVLADDRGHFPEYQAVILYRDDLAASAPAAVDGFAAIAGRISESAMIAMNARAKLDRVPETQVAADFLQASLGLDVVPVAESAVGEVVRRTREHLLLVVTSMLAAILVAVPLGIAAARRERLGQAILGITGVLQTIPSLALLVFMIPLLGIGAAPAIAALFLYSLLPIVRNTHAGLCSIPLDIRESAEALGLPRAARLRRIELPMAARSILAGIKIACVINIGTATLGALIGAGGYGQPILTGIRLDDMGLILRGAVPAALLALAAQGGFELAERLVVPEGLRLRLTSDT